jgi:hypothetical protein
MAENQSGASLSKGVPKISEMMHQLGITEEDLDDVVLRNKRCRWRKLHSGWLLPWFLLKVNIPSSSFSKI